MMDEILISDMSKECYKVLAAICWCWWMIIYLQYFNQILKAVLEVLDDPNSSTREVTLQLVTVMVNKQVCGTKTNILSNKWSSE